MGTIMFSSFFSRFKHHRHSEESTYILMTVKSIAHPKMRAPGQQQKNCEVMRHWRHCPFQVDGVGYPEMEMDVHFSLSVVIRCQIESNRPDISLHMEWCRVKKSEQLEKRVVYQGVFYSSAPWNPWAVRVPNAADGSINNGVFFSLSLLLSFSLSWAFVRRRDAYIQG